MTPKYTVCHANILGAILPATVTFGTCDFLHHITSGSGDNYAGTVDLVCPSGDVEFEIYKEGTTPANHSPANLVCQITIKAQTGMGPLDYNVITGSPNDLQFIWTVTNMAYTRVAGTLAACGAASGTATGTSHTTIRAFNGVGTQISASID